MSTVKNIETSEDVSITVSKNDKLMSMLSGGNIVLKNTKTDSNDVYNIGDCLQSALDHNARYDTVRIKVTKGSIPLWMIRVWYTIAFEYVFKGIYPCKITLIEDDQSIMIDATLTIPRSRNNFKRFATIIRQPFNNNFLLSNMQPSHMRNMLNLLSVEKYKEDVNFCIILYLLSWIYSNNGSKTLFNSVGVPHLSEAVFMKLKKLNTESEYVSNTIAFDLSDANSFSLEGGFVTYSKNKQQSFKRLPFNISFTQGVFNGLSIKREHLSEVITPSLDIRSNKDCIPNYMANYSIRRLHSIIDMAYSVSRLSTTRLDGNDCISLYNTFVEHLRKNPYNIAQYDKCGIGHTVVFKDIDTTNGCLMEMDNRADCIKVQLT